MVPGLSPGHRELRDEPASINRGITGYIYVAFYTQSVIQRHVEV